MLKGAFQNGLVTNGCAVLVLTSQKTCCVGVGNVNQSKMQCGVVFPIILQFLVFLLRGYKRFVVEVDSGLSIPERASATMLSSPEM